MFLMGWCVSFDSLCFLCFKMSRLFCYLGTHVMSVRLWIKSFLERLGSQISRKRIRVFNVQYGQKLDFLKPIATLILLAHFPMYL
jgi:hypothetical protein